MYHYIVKIQVAQAVYLQKSEKSRSFPPRDSSSCLFETEKTAESQALLTGHLLLLSLNHLLNHITAYRSVLRGCQVSVVSVG